MLPYRRNLFAVTAATFIGFTGFTLVMPFLPLYFRQLGVTDVGEIALWSGLSLGVTPAMTALLAPFWGRLADRFGRKIMVERSLASFVLVMASMAFVTKAWHVFALRAIQGLFAGYGALTLTMAAETAPRDRMAQAIGQVQTAQRLGPALGPIIGGTVAQIVGLRNAFLVTSAFYVVALVLVFVMYHEPSTRTAGDSSAPGPVSFRTVLAFENFVLLMAVVFGLQFVDRSFGPILPLYLAQIGTPLARVPLVAGVLFSIAAGAAALGNYVCSRLLDRTTPKTVIAGSAAAGAVGALLYARRARYHLGGGRDASLRRRNGDCDHGSLHSRGSGHSGDRARREFRAAEHGVADRAGHQPDRQRLSRRDEHPRRVPPRRGRVGLRRIPGVAADGDQARREDGYSGSGGTVIRIAVDPTEPDPAAIAQAADILRLGGVVAFPTDTFYGLAVDPRLDFAVARLFTIKERDPASAVALIAADLGQARQAGRFDADALTLAGRFWPGPLTVVVPVSSQPSTRLTADLGTVGVRVPAHAVARALASAFGWCITATSANLSGRPAARTGGEIGPEFSDRIDAVIDAGPAPGGAPSTIVEFVDGRPVLRRSGAIAWERVLESLQ